MACWRHGAPPLFVAVWLLIPAGCCSISSTPAGAAPTLPVLPSLQRLTHQGQEGVWMDATDAGRLALWIYDLTGEAGN